jgi:hypothetical protein
MNQRTSCASIGEFFNTIRHKPTSLERNETNTLSVEAHPRDGESVEAKGMPKSRTEKEAE